MGVATQAQVAAEAEQNRIAANRSQLGDTENPMPTFSEWTELNSWCIRGKVPLPPPEFLESPRYKEPRKVDASRLRPAWKWDRTTHSWQYHT